MSDTQRLTDAQLVAAYRGGDREAFAGIYDRYADRIYSYCLTMLRNRDDAADAAHDAFVKAATRLDQLDDPEKLRPWLFAVARNEAYGQGRRRSRVTPEPDLSEALVEEPDLSLGVRRDELRELVWAAADGLGERDRQLLTLHLVEGLEGDDLARAMGVATPHVRVLVSRMRDRVEKALGALLIARLGNEDCDELAGVVGDWDGSFSLEVRSRVTRHVESCDTCRDRRAFLLAPANVLPAIMAVPAPPALRERVLSTVERGGAATPLPLSPDMAKIAIFAAVALVLGLIGVAVSGQFDPVIPPASAPVTGPPVVGGATTTTTPAGGPAPSTTEGAGSTTAAAGAPAAISSSTDSIDFGDDGTTGEFDLTNTGGQPGDWTVQSSSEAISVSVGSGQLAQGATETVTVSLDRTMIAEGELAETLTVTAAAGESAIAVVGLHEDNPIIHNPRANPAEVAMSGSSPDCVDTQTTVSARIRDTSPLESVLVRWSPDGGRTEETEMNAMGNDIFEAVVGPYTVARADEVRIVAFDERGNAGGASVVVTVNACP